MYKYTQQSHERIAAALAPVGPEAREELLQAVWKIFGVAWEARAGQLFPSPVVYAQGVAGDLERMTEAVNNLAKELAASRDELAASKAESRERLEELVEIRPLTNAAKALTLRAEMAERERDSWQRRAERLKGELAEAKEDAANGWAAEAAARAAAETREKTLVADKVRAKEEAAAKFAEAESEWAAERAAMLAELEANRLVVAEAEKATKLAKYNTGSLKADIAFLREKIAAAEAAQKAAEDRCAAAEANEQIAVAERDAAKAAKLELEALNAELEANLKHETDRADGVTARLTLTAGGRLTRSIRFYSLD